jgi:nucleoside-diphosphate-sugar epimerase
MTTLAVTGASGFIGGHLTAAAAAAGWRVRVVSRAALAGPGLARELEGVVAVVHLAARVHCPGGHNGSEDRYRADNVALTERLAGACVAAGVQRLVFMSSAGVLGRCSSPEGFTDSSLPAPYDAYTRSKLAAEELLRERFSGRLELAMIRPPVVYGPGAKGSFSRLARLADSRLALPLGGLKAPRSLISVRNLCDLTLLVARHSHAAGLCMLASDARTTSVAELLALLRKARGRPARLFEVPRSLLGVALRAAGKGEYVPALAQPFVLHGSLAHQHLDWVPAHALEDEIQWSQGEVSSRSLAA